MTQPPSITRGFFDPSALGTYFDGIHATLHSGGDGWRVWSIDRVFIKEEDRICGLVNATHLARGYRGKFHPWIVSLRGSQDWKFELESVFGGEYTILKTFPTKQQAIDYAVVESVSRESRKTFIK